MTVAPRFAFDNSYARLPERFFARLDPAVAPAPQMLALNAPLAETLGLDPVALAGPEGVAILSGAVVPDGASPLAMAYAGHQFGNFVPQLGDGRAVLLGEVIRPDGARRDIQLKGAGRTPFSRMGDGKAALGPVLREFLVSEAMHALGVRTTRALAAVSTGERVVREEISRGAILTRVARSHIRVGTFQFFAARQDREGLQILVDHVIARHHPAAADAPVPAAALLAHVVAAQARLVASWLSVGFIHGVMNTDNMSVAGETIDFGPCAFLDAYQAGRVYSSIDREGRYAFGNQPRAAHWNLLQLAQALLPLMGADEGAAVAAAQAALDQFSDLYERAWTDALRAKLGLEGARDADAALGADLLTRMEGGAADFTLTFRNLADLPGAIDGAGPASDGAVRDLFADPTAFDAWAVRWRARLAETPREDGARRAAMRAVNPAVIARNHMVEEALVAAHHGDLAPFEALRAALAAPFDDHPEAPRLSAPPLPGEEVRATFCGT
jgi:uncharacterized protein YdiU (UPF0061 family)